MAGETIPSFSDMFLLSIKKLKSRRRCALDGLHQVYDFLGASGYFIVDYDMVKFALGRQFNLGAD